MTQAPSATLGLSVTAAVAAASTAVCAVGYLSPSSAPLVALAFGLVVKQLAGRDSNAWEPGLALSRKHFLRAAVILLGLQVSTTEVFDAGWSVVFVDVFMVISTLGVAWTVSRLLRMNGELAALIGVGAAICGHSAVAAAQQVLKAKPEHATAAFATVVAAGFMCLALYPALFVLNEQLAIADHAAFGRYIGSTVHEVSQVMAISTSLSPQVAETAIAAKMGRVLLLCPVLVLMVVGFQIISDRPHEPDNGRRSYAAVLAACALPGLFTIAVFVNWLTPMVSQAQPLYAAGALALTGAALAAIGASTDIHQVRRIGLRPFVLASALATWLVLGGALVNTSI